MKNKFLKLSNVALTAAAMVFGSCQPKRYNSFTPGELWLDDNGVVNVPMKQTN